MVEARWIAQTIRDFGLGLGLKQLGINENGVAAFQIGSMGSFFIEPSEDTVLVYAAQEFTRLSLIEMERALGLCGPASQRSVQLRAGIKGDSQLVLCVRLPAAEFTLARLESCISAIVDGFAAVRAM